MRKCFFLLILFSALSCRKEGLSHDTGNLEITVPSGDWIPQWQYRIYTEDQFGRYLNYQEAFAIRDGFSHRGTITEKGLAQGNYGLVVFQNGTGYTKAFQVIANKVNKFPVP